jgi:hypothetical protein
MLKQLKHTASENIHENYFPLITQAGKVLFAMH